MNVIESKRGNTGGNLFKKCVECGMNISKYDKSMCLDCREDQLDKMDKPLAPYPTYALPGTTKKILILSWRSLKGYDLWHPGDLTSKDLLTDKWLNPSVEQEEFEEKILTEIREVLKELDETRKSNYEKKKLAIKTRLEKLGYN